MRDSSFKRRKNINKQLFLTFFILQIDFVIIPSCLVFTGKKRDTFYIFYFPVENMHKNGTMSLLIIK